MAGKSVQFFGKEKVLQAYRARGIDTWGLFDNKQFINAGESAEDLAAFLDMLEPGGSQSIYTLKVYRDIDDPDELTDRTECNGSFNFKLFAAMKDASLPAVVGNASPGARYADPIMAKLQGIVMEEVGNAIDKRLNGVKDEEPEENWNDVMMGYVKEPQKIVALLPIINAIGGYFKPGFNIGMPMAMAGVNNAKRAGIDESEVEIDTSESIGTLNQTKMQRLAAVLDRLEKADPDILIHLEKLADIAEKKPDTYKMALSFL